jgi:putative ABC transport system substrate-binding protein
MHFHQWKRREVITLVGGAAAAWPLAARAQQPAMPVVGFIFGGAADASSRYAAAFRKGLGERGYIEGQNVVVEYHSLEGEYNRSPALMADLVRRRVAVIATTGATPVALAAKAATATIPIVFSVPDDPVKLGLVASLARPGGNATGVNFFIQEITAKRLGLLHELVPRAARIAVLVNPANAYSTETTLKEAPEAARVLGLQVEVFKASTSREIDAVYAAVVRERLDALFVAGDGFFNSRRVQFATMAARDRLPASYSVREIRRSGRADQLRDKPLGDVPRGRELYRQHPPRRQAHRTSGAAVDQVRVRHQPADGKSARPRSTADAARACRRGDRMKRREFITLLGGAAAWPLAAPAQQAGKVYRISSRSARLRCLSHLVGRRSQRRPAQFVP